MRLALALVLAALIALPATVRATAEQGPVLEVPTDKLAAALNCPSTYRAGGDEPVLLVHGTFFDDDANWGWNYRPQLTSLGFDVCTVRLPNYSMDDIQVAAEYVVYGVRQIAARSQEKVDMITSSQGALQGRWAVKWWPDVLGSVDDLVTFAGPNHGTQATDLQSAFGRCIPACWQMDPDSNFLRALNAGDETPGSISYTNLYSHFDQLVFPQLPESTSALDGATNIAVQDVCPGRPSDHTAMSTADAVAYALALDALTNPGGADTASFDIATCAQALMPGADASKLGGSGSPGTLDDWSVEAEPPLKSYARGAAAADTDDERPAPAEFVAGGASSDDAVLPLTGSPILALAAIGVTLLALGLQLLATSGLQTSLSGR